MSEDQAKSYRALENARRRISVRNDETDHALLVEINALLADRKETEAEETSLTRPTIFVMGLPRSGTTLLYQVIAAGLDIGFVDCIAARFWQAPDLGLRLSRHMSRGKRSFTFESHYGTPDSPYEPHEFSYFWNRWMNISDADPETGRPLDCNDVDWSGFVAELGRMQQVVAKPMVFKALAALGRIGELAIHVPMSIFVLIERDPIDTAASLLATRKHYYGTLKQWWSLYPARFDELKNLEPVSQVAGQVSFLKQQFIDELESIDSPVLRCHYTDLCGHPRSILEAIRRTSLESWGVDIAHTEEPLNSFRVRRPDISDERREELKTALASFGCSESISNDESLPRVPYTSVSVDSETAHSVETLVRTGHLVTGSEVSRLEDELSERLDGRYVACVSSGLAALEIMLHVLGGSTRRVAMPSFVCEALALAAQRAGSEIDLLDVDAETMNLSETASARDILIVPHHFGLPVRLKEMRSELIIEDIAHALGASIDGQLCGTLAPFAFTSFYATKLVGGIHGGAVIASDASFIDEIRDLRQYNHRKEYRLRFQYPMSDPCAAIVRGNLGRLDRDRARRTEIARCYNVALDSLPLTLPRIPESVVPSWYRYVIRSIDTIRILAECDRRGIEVAWALSQGIHHRLGLPEERFPSTNRLCREALMLPMSRELSEKEIERVIEALKRACEGV